LAHAVNGVLIESPINDYVVLMKYGYYVANMVLSQKMIIFPPNYQLVLSICHCQYLKGISTS